MSQQGSTPSSKSVVQQLEDRSIIKEEEASVPMTEIQISEVSEDYNPLAPPRCGGVKGKVFWCGGGMLSASKHHRPKSTLCYRPDDFKSACKVEEGCQQGLRETKWLYLDEKKSKITLTSWIDAL